MEAEHEQESISRALVAPTVTTVVLVIGVLYFRSRFDDRFQYTVFFFELPSTRCWLTVILCLLLLLGALAWVSHADDAMSRFGRTWIRYLRVLLVWLGIMFACGLFCAGSLIGSIVDFTYSEPVTIGNSKYIAGSMFSSALFYDDEDSVQYFLYECDCFVLLCRVHYSESFFWGEFVENSAKAHLMQDDTSDTLAVVVGEDTIFTYFVK